MISVVILCAGSSTRFNGEKNKVLLSLGDKPVFMHSVDKFKNYSDDIIVVSNEKDIKEIVTPGVSPSAGESPSWSCSCSRSFKRPYV